MGGNDGRIVRLDNTGSDLIDFFPMSSITLRLRTPRPLASSCCTSAVAAPQHAAPPVALAFSGQGASAQPIETLEARADRLADELERLEQRGAALNEQYLQVTEELEVVRAERDENAAAVEAASDRIEATRAEAAGYMVEAYVGAGAHEQALAAASSDPNDAVNSQVMLDILRGDRELLADDIAAGRRDLEDRAADLAETDERLEATERDQRRVVEELEASIDQQSELLDSANDELRAAIEAERQRGRGPGSSCSRSARRGGRRRSRPERSGGRDHHSALPDHRSATRAGLRPGVCGRSCSIGRPRSIGGPRTSGPCARSAIAAGPGLAPPRPVRSGCHRRSEVPDRSRVPLGRYEPCDGLRLLRAHQLGLGPGRGRHSPYLPCAAGRIAAHLGVPAPSRRPGLLRQPRVPRRHVRRWRADDPLAPHGLLGAHHRDPPWLRWADALRSGRLSEQRAERSAQRSGRSTSSWRPERFRCQRAGR